ncbi:MAG: DUF4105 domain-containing protein [Arenicella sp.]
MMFLTIVCFALFVLFLSLKTPGNEKQWRLAQQVLPEITLEDDTITVKGLRDFRYNSDGSVAEANYKTQAYRVSELKAAWYGISHFGKFGLAHVFMSFEFADGQYLVVSIEARRRENEDYNPIKGLFRAYTKMVVLGTEQDVIGLRSNVHKEPVYLYALTITKLNQTSLLLNYLRGAQHLNWKPEFYNTLLDNCITGLLEESKPFSSWTSWLDTRILLPGKSDQLAYQLGFIDNEQPFDMVQGRALVDAAILPDDAAFSSSIRL